MNLKVGNMKQKLDIQAESTRDQEGYIDTNIGIFLDITIKKENFNNFKIRLEKIVNEMKKLYPPLDYDELEIIEDDLDEDDFDEDDINNYIISWSRITFGIIENQQPTTLHNIASLGSIIFAYKVAEEFQNEFIINKHIDINGMDIKKIPKHISLDFETSLMYTIAERGGLDFDYDFDFLKPYIKDETKYNLLMDDFTEELDGEFGFKFPSDNTVPIWEYNPFKTSPETREAISINCNRIKYDELFYMLDKIQHK